MVTVKVKVEVQVVFFFRPRLVDYGFVSFSRRLTKSPLWVQVYE